MQELTLLGRNRGAHSEETSTSGEFQTRWSVVGGQRGGQMSRGGRSGSSLPIAAEGSWGSIPPSIVDAFEHQGTNCTQEFRKEVSDSTTSGSITKRRRSRNKLLKDEQRTTEARDHCRRRVLMWFENHHWEHLENKYLNNSKRGIDVVKKELNLIVSQAMNGDKFAEDQ